jgi:hypothetical protein
MNSTVGGRWVVYSTTDDDPHHAYGLRLNLMVISRIQHMLQCGPLARVHFSRKNRSSNMAPMEEDDDFISEIQRPS